MFMPNPAWFDANYFAQQKVDQMNATGYEMGEGEWLATNGGGATEWTVALYSQYLSQYTNPATGQPVTAYENFEACNGSDYEAGIGIEDINVAPNQYFNVEEYLQSLADYNNANPDAYDGAAPAGGWTVASELDTIFNTYHSSVWAHYNANWDTLLINPSNGFDTMAYLQARAQAMGDGATWEDARDAIREAGSNPVEDLYGFGAEHDITATAVATPVTPVLPDGGWTVWGEPVTPPAPADTDPFEQNVTNVAVTSTQTDYPGEGESYSGNTQFDARWLPSSTDSTLNAKDVIKAEEGTYSTLSVTLGKNWTGFNGVKQDDGTTAPSIDNIGRVQLIHNPKNNEASYNFDARNISDDAYRFDLDGASGPGSINLNNLSGAVNEIHISDLMPKDISKNNSKAPNDTAINFVDGANTGKQDDLLLVVENVGGGASTAAAITSKNFGIENLTVQADKGDGTSYVNLSGLEGVKTLKVTGEGSIEITNVADGIRTYDASEAKGDVNMAVVSPRSSTVVKGGAGNDTVTLNNPGSWTPVGLENIENLELNGGEIVNLVNVGAGLTDLWGLSNDGTLKNLTADNFNVHLDGGTGAVTVNGNKEGSLVNITFLTDADTRSANADSLSTNAVGTVTLTAGESAASFSTGKFNADSATELAVNAACAVTVGTDEGINPEADSMKAVQNVTLNLENSSANVDSSFVYVDLPSAQNVTVNAGGQNVTMQKLGTAKNDSTITLDVNDANNFIVGDIETSLGCNINADIAAEGDVQVGDLGNKTDVLKGNQGDIHLTVAGDSFTAVGNAATFNGGPMTINLGEVTGNANGGLNVAGVVQEFTLHSQGTISYTGAQGADTLKVTAVESGSTGSVFALGGGTDNIELDATAAGKGTGTTTVTVDLSEDAVATDTININAQSAGYNNLLINVEGFDATGATHDIIDGVYIQYAFEIGGAGGPSNAQIDLANVLEDFGIINEATASIALSIGNAVANLKGAFTYDGNVYALDSNANVGDDATNAISVSNVTTLVCLGSVDDLADAVANCFQ